MPIKAPPAAVAALGGIIVASVIFLLFGFGSLPESGNLVPSPWDKAVHLMIFAVFAFGLRLLMPESHWMLLFAVVASIAILDEVHQFLVPTRQPAWDDGMADLLGAAIGLLCWKQCCRRENGARP